MTDPGGRHGHSPRIICSPDCAAVQDHHFAFIHNSVTVVVHMPVNGHIQTGDGNFCSGRHGQFRITRSKDIFIELNDVIVRCVRGITDHFRQILEQQIRGIHIRLFRTGNGQRDGIKRMPVFSRLDRCRFHKTRTVFQIPVAARTGGVGGRRHIRTRQIGNVLNERTPFFRVRGITAVNENVRIRRKVFADVFPVGRIERGVVDLVAIQRNETFVTVRHDMQCGINRIGMSIQIIIDGIHGIRAGFQLKHFAIFINTRKQRFRIRHTGVQHHKHFGFFAANGGNRIGNHIRIRRRNCRLCHFR